MNISSTFALPLVLLLIACSYASPMFGTGGVMKRKFPGATDMTYHAYRGIVNSNAASAASGAAARTGGGAIAPRTGGSSSGDTAWMFDNGLAAPSPVISSNQPESFTQSGLSLNQQQPSINLQQASFNQQQPSFNQQQVSYHQQGLAFRPQDFQNTYQGRYPSVWNPRESYASLQFPYHAPTLFDYDEVFIPQNKIHNDYY